MTKMVKMTKLEEDALLELTNMFSWHASMALEKISGKNVELNVVNKSIISYIISLGHGNEFFHKAPEMFLGIYSAIEKSQLDGNIFMAFPKDSALMLYDALLKKKKVGVTKIVDDSVKNVLTEFGNIVFGQVLGVLNKQLKVNARHMVPSLVSSFGDNIYDYVYFNMRQKNKKAILIKVDTEFKLKEKIINGQLMLLLSHQSFGHLLQKINKEAKL